MELRAPPKPTQHAPQSSRGSAVVIVLLLCALAMLAWLLMRDLSGVEAKRHSAEADDVRALAGKLKAAGALGEAAKLYERYLETSAADEKIRANIAYSLGDMQSEGGNYEAALRWFYEAERLGGGGLGDKLSGKIVATLERLGRFHQAQAALDARAGLEEGETVQRGKDDAVVATVGKRDIYRSDVERALDDLPPQLAERFSGEKERQEFLRKYVVDELLWRKAKKLAYDNDPEVRRQLEGMMKQVVVGAFIEREVLGKIQVEAADVKTFYDANKERYAEGEGDKKTIPAFEKVAERVTRDYQTMKMQAAYQKLIEEQLATEDVHINMDAWR